MTDPDDDSADQAPPSWFGYALVAIYVGTLVGLATLATIAALKVRAGMGLV